VNQASESWVILDNLKHIMTAGVYEFRDLMFITYPSKEIIGVKAYILLDHLLFSGLFQS
jgi:hypothetical protein